jgi:hypothetical protein
MLFLERCNRVNNVDLVLLTFEIYVYDYEAPVRVLIIVIW